MSARHHPRDVGHPTDVRQLTGRARSTTEARSRLCGSVPNAEPQSPPSRDAQNASATSGGAYRTSSDPWSTSAIRSTYADAVKSLEVSLAANESYQTGKPVKVRV